MPYPVLIAQTPRAGRLNHVNLLPDTPELPTGFHPADYLGAALGCPAGANYVSASRSVRHADTAREGRELLVLAGVEPPTDLVTSTGLRDWLDRKLEDLGRVVTRTDWSKADGADHRLPELVSWAEECVNAFRLRPYAGDRSRPVVAVRRGPRGRSGLWIGVLLAAAVAAVFAISYPKQTFPGGTPPAPGGGTKRDDEFVRAWVGFRQNFPPAANEDTMTRMAVALDGVGGFEKPGNFDRLGPEQQSDWLSRCRPFREWVVGSFGENGSGGFTPYLPSPDLPLQDDLGRIRNLVGEMRSGTAVLAARVRMKAIQNMFVTLDTLETPKLSDSQQLNNFPLLQWLADDNHRADTNNVPLPKDIPFLTPKEAKVWAQLADRAEKLAISIGKEIPPLKEEGVRLFAIGNSKRLAELTKHFSTYKEHGYRMGGDGPGGPLPVALRMVKELEKFPQLAGEK